ncbi:MAG TPA: hypothetical protein VF765_15550 [Polyangiaceae bacterium]
MKSCRRMGKTAAVVVLVLGSAACARGAAAQSAGSRHPGEQPSAQHRATTEAPPAAKAASLVNTTAKVEKVDKSNGLVTLRGPKGRTVEVKAGPEVDLNRLHAGDTVQATYYEEVVVSLAKASTGTPKMSSMAVKRGGVTAMQATVTARIVSVDPRNNTIVIRGPMGGEETLKVDDPALRARLKDVRPGDAFDVTYTQAVAVALEPRKK